MTGLVLVLDDETASHLAQALSAHCLEMRKNGRIVPSTVTALLRAVATTDAATPGQSRPTLADAAGRLLTYSQAAGLLGVSDRTIRRWVRAGALRPVSWAGGRPRLVADELQAMLGRQEGREAG